MSREVMDEQDIHLTADLARLYKDKHSVPTDQVAALIAASDLLKQREEALVRIHWLAAEPSKNAQAIIEICESTGVVGANQ